MMTKLLILLLTSPILASYYNVNDYGIIGDGMTDNTFAINQLINNTTNGTIYFGPGNYLISNQGGYTCISIQNKNNIKIVGDTNTIFKTKDNSRCHSINLVNVNNITFENIIIDGNRNGQTEGGTHGIRGNNVINCNFKDITIQNTMHYGIGLQSGSVQNVNIENIIIRNTGGDGIDVKNKNNDNYNNTINGAEINYIGLNKYKTQAGIDLRGEWNVKNIKVYIRNDQHGIRFRQGEIGEVHGLGGHNSILSDFEIYGKDGSKNSIGIYNAARNVHITNGIIAWSGIGFKMERVSNLANNNYISDVNIINVLKFGMWLYSDYNHVMDSYSKSLYEGARIQGNYNTIQDSRIISTVLYYAIRFTENHNTIHSCYINGYVSDLGNNNIVYNK